MTTSEPKYAKHGDPSEVKITPVKAGEEYSAPVVGGFVRRRAEEDGLYFESLEHGFYVSKTTLMNKLNEIPYEDKG